METREAVGSREAEDPAKVSNTSTENRALKIWR
jgi:hypothetical protein